MFSGIYKIENIVNGKVYVGSAKNLSQRRRGLKNLKDYKVRLSE